MSIALQDRYVACSWWSPVSAIGGLNGRCNRQSPARHGSGNEFHANAPHTAQVHLWLAFEDQVQDRDLLRRYRQILTEDERAQEQRLRFVEDQRRYVLARALVRTVLSQYADVKPEQWRFTRNEYGRPAIAGATGRTSLLAFNLSHTAGLVILAVACARAVGADVEKVHRSPAAMDIAGSYFSLAEIRALQSLPADERQRRFFDYWTLKESYIKAVGKGLAIPLDRFSFDLSQRHGIRISFEAQLEDDPARWSFWSFKPCADHVIAVCAQRAAHEHVELTMRTVVPMVSASSAEFIPRRVRPAG